jgi:hypothetical protein
MLTYVKQGRGFHLLDVVPGAPNRYASWLEPKSEACDRSVLPRCRRAKRCRIGSRYPWRRPDRGQNSPPDTPFVLHGGQDPGGLGLFKKRLADRETTDTKRERLLKLLEEKEAKDVRDADTGLL